MRHEKFLRTYVLAACVSFSCGWAFASEHPSARVRRAKPWQLATMQEPKLSDDERKAVIKVNEAKDAAAKLRASTEFLKKYPNSQMRGRVAEHVASHITLVQDAAQRATLAEGFLAVFTGPGEADHVNSTRANDYITLNRLDDAFRAAGPWLERKPDELATRTRLAIIGVNMAHKSDPRFLPQSRQYALQAIEMMEADKKPSGVDEAQWKQYKTTWLPQLQLSLGLIAYSDQNAAEAKSRLEKAAALGSAEPNTFAVLGDLTEKEYAELARKHQGTAPGPEKDATLKRALERLDRVIELFAQAVALTGEKPEYKLLRDHITVPLTDYYKYRHNNSTEGLQQLIDKYKKPAAQ